MTAPPIHAESVCDGCGGACDRGSQLDKAGGSGAGCADLTLTPCTDCHGTGTRTVTLTGIDALAMDYARKRMEWLRSMSRAAHLIMCEAEDAYRAAALTPGERGTA